MTQNQKRSNKGEEKSSKSALLSKMPMLDGGKRDCNGVDLAKVEGVLRVAKLPIPLKVDFASEAGVCKTQEGEQSYAAGDAIVTGTKGEQWPIPRASFDETYEPAGEGMYAKKNIEVLGIQMDESFTVTPSWSDKPLEGKKGDWLVQYGPNDHGIVSMEIFAETYRVCE